MSGKVTPVLPFLLHFKMCVSHCMGLQATDCWCNKNDFSVWQKHWLFYKNGIWYITVANLYLIQFFFFFKSIAQRHGLDIQIQIFGSRITVLLVLVLSWDLITFFFTLSLWHAAILTSFFRANKQNTKKKQVCGVEPTWVNKKGLICREEWFQTLSGTTFKSSL